MLKSLNKLMSHALFGLSPSAKDIDSDQPVRTAHADLSRCLWLW